MSADILVRNVFTKSLSTSHITGSPTLQLCAHAGFRSQHLNTTTANKLLKDETHIKECERLNYSLPDACTTSA